MSWHLLSCPLWWLCGCTPMFQNSTLLWCYFSPPTPRPVLGLLWPYHRQYRRSCTRCRKLSDAIYFGCLFLGAHMDMQRQLCTEVLCGAGGDSTSTHILTDLTIKHVISRLLIDKLPTNNQNKWNPKDSPRRCLGLSQASCCDAELPRPLLPFVDMLYVHPYYCANWGEPERAPYYIERSVVEFLGIVRYCILHVLVCISGLPFRKIRIQNGVVLSSGCFALCPFRLNSLDGPVIGVYYTGVASGMHRSIINVCFRYSTNLRLSPTQSSTHMSWFSWNTCHARELMLTPSMPTQPLYIIVTYDYTILTSTPHLHLMKPKMGKQLRWLVCQAVPSLDTIVQSKIIQFLLTSWVGWLVQWWETKPVPCSGTYTKQTSLPWCLVQSQQT